MWTTIKGTNGKARFKRVKEGKHTVEIAEKKVKGAWKKLYKYKVK